VQEQHKALNPKPTLHSIFLGVGNTIYNAHAIEPLKDLGFDSQRVQKHASKLLVHSVNYAARHAHTIRTLSVVKFHQACSG